MQSAYRIGVLILETAIKTHETNDLQLLDAVQPQLREIYEQGIAHVEDGRNAANEMRDYLALQQPRTDQESRLKEVLIDMLDDNVPEAFDVEERYLIAFFQMGSSADILNESELDSLMLQVTLLEDERARLTLERQNAIAGLQ